MVESTYAELAGVGFVLLFAGIPLGGWFGWRAAQWWQQRETEREWARMEKEAEEMIKELDEAEALADIRKLAESFEATFVTRKGFIGFDISDARDFFNGIKAILDRVDGDG